MTSKSLIVKGVEVSATSEHTEQKHIDAVAALILLLSEGKLPACAYANLQEIQDVWDGR